MKTSIVISALSIAIFLNACSSSKKESAEMLIQTDSMSMPSSTTALSSIAFPAFKDSIRKFVRTAELKFKVKSVEKATYIIESCVNRHGGYVVKTHLNSSIDNVNTTVISADSALETTSYTMVNAITLRVPNNMLDTTLSEISKNIDFLDYRNINADDVALKIKSNILAQKRSAKTEIRLANAIEKHGKKLNETIDAENKILNSEVLKDNVQLANINLEDLVNFSTVTLNIYQAQATKNEFIKINVNPRPYEPGLGVKLYEAFDSGFRLLENLMVFVVRIWSLLLLSLIGFVAYKRYRIYSFNKDVAE